MSYSGGKDSDVILALAKEAGINFKPIYKNTTIDPPGTIKHAVENGAQIMRPQLSFFQLIEKKGFPTRRVRFCCDYLKEYAVLENAIQGIRRSESTSRSKRYNENEPVVCRVYRHNKSNRANIIMPILNWTDDDVTEFITLNNIKCHPLYYNDDGSFNVKKRLGCMCCPMRNNPVPEFKERPLMVRQWIKAGKKWFDRPRDKEIASKAKFGTIYDLFYHNVFCHTYQEYVNVRDSMFGRTDFKQLLEDYFKIDLNV